MDIELARTFLAIVETGSFAEAAKKVHVTQSTVSVRVKTLEEQLGRAVFQRGKSGAALTHAGRQFYRHALTLVRVWQSARLDVALPEGVEETLSIGGQPSLWDGFLLEWIAQVRRRAPQLALRTELGFSDALIDDMTKGLIDLAVLYAPQVRPGYVVERLFDDEFVLVSSEKTVEPIADRLPESYVYVDWGPEFRAEHAAYFPDQTTPALQLRLGAIGLTYLFVTPSSAYFPRRVVATSLEDGSLRAIEDAPSFTCPTFAVFPESDQSAGLALALDCLRETAATLGRK